MTTAFDNRINFPKIQVFTVILRSVFGTEQLVVNGEFERASEMCLYARCEL